MNKKTLAVSKAALTAALYVTLACLANSLGLASGAVQLRLSEALCVFPVFGFSFVPGVTVGCLIFNLLFSGNILDIIFGTLATFIGALCALAFKNHKYLAFIPTVISNTVIIPFVIAYGFMDGNLSTYPIVALGIFVGEFLSCGVIGNFLLKLIEKYKLSL